MRLNNRSKVGRFNFVSTVVCILMVLAIVLFITDRYKLNLMGNSSYLILIFPTIIAIIYYLRGRQIFEYDSEGEALNFKNQNVVLFFDKPVVHEFPKYKLLEYEIVNAVVLKRLYITISSKKSGTVKLKYDVSYLTKKELHDLKISLSRVIRNNREKKIETII
ncbi:hypothetical protein FNJ88_13770 [Chryseobacterium sp. SNU WT5]|uniref:hypothetical protein n=1 Tax=Chryseobacterium sp. SNU WT5 TaxID=2594269 RepID=UPI00117EA8C1|nr:hypothetical protein [Chryseobacterium sp. SNU WT5]QDP86566.1 hypothetical protein FNJ88_13770 [Chryseobacterium sp. SNU WT5]